METKPETGSSPAAAAAPAKTSVAWDEYFPLINKGVMFLILILAVVFCTGVDLSALANKVLSRDSADVSASAVATGEPVSSGRGFSLSVWGPGGWKVALGLVGAMMFIALMTLSVLSTSGRDAERMKEQAAKNKEDRKCKPTGGTDATENTECNLASYKLFYPQPETPAETPVASTHA